MDISGNIDMGKNSNGHTSKATNLHIQWKKLSKEDEYIQLDHCSHSNSAGHYCGINIVEILNAGGSSGQLPKRVACNIFFLSRPQNV